MRYEKKTGLKEKIIKIKTMDIKQLPKQPGIYFMKNSQGTIIYVGKAKNLKTRVSQYFQKNKNHSPKITEMISQIDTFEYQTTDTELEAFLLECKTIKELKPRFNKLLKNYKGYKYLRITIEEDYPKISMTTQRKQDGALYFGPFTSENSVENCIDFIKDYYPIRKCSSRSSGNNSSGCLNFHLGNCLGPCLSSDIHKEYRDQINKIVSLLQGVDQYPLKDLNSKMKAAASNLEFEKAVKYREYLRGVRHVINKQKIIKISRYGRNIIAAEKYGDSTLKLFFIKGNKLLNMETVNLPEQNNETSIHALENKLRDIAITCFKKAKGNVEAGMSQQDIDEAQIIYSYLKNKNNGVLSFKIPISRIEHINYKKIIEDIL